MEKAPLELLQSSYRSLNIVSVTKFRRLEWAGHVARIEGGRSALKILKHTSTGKRPLERLRRRWEDNIRMYLKEMGVSRRKLNGTRITGEKL